jgi:tetratricopeptide (TPR) repeat protein
MIFPALFLVLLAAPQEAVTSSDVPAADSSAVQADIDAGLALFRKHHFAQAEADFQKAVDANPQSAAAHFYLGYAIYKIAEPKRPFHPDKQKAAAEFAKAYDLDPAFRPVWAGRK